MKKRRNKCGDGNWGKEREKNRKTRQKKERPERQKGEKDGEKVNKDLRIKMERKEQRQKEQRKKAERKYRKRVKRVRERERTKDRLRGLKKTCADMQASSNLEPLFPVRHEAGQAKKGKIIHGDLSCLCHVLPAGGQSSHQLLVKSGVYM